jgi:hypothetical protein
MGHRIDLFCEDLPQKLTVIESGLQGPESNGRG